MMAGVRLVDEFPPGPLASVCGPLRDGHYLLGVPKTVSRISGAGVQRFSTAARLPRQNRVCICAPDVPIVEVPDGDPAFHTVYDLEHRYQISGQWSLGSGIPYLNGGVIPHWRAIYDDRQRLQVAIWVNNDTGDSWEWADDPSYPERYSALGIRIAVNYVVYAMTH
ncbi:MAG TPA: DUF4159 domain-containing protein [Bryobacteraceae bacterium]|nr:DUF4159 domain-containing protein [Bryobacteraceae bacterium]